MRNTHFSGVDSKLGYSVNGSQVIDENGDFVGHSNVRVASVTLTPAQIRTLRATPRELVPAPGAGKVIQFLGAQLHLAYATAGYTEDSDNLRIKYEDDSGVHVTDTIECTGFIDQTAATMTSAVPIKDAIVANTGAVNKPLVLHNIGSGEFDGATAAGTLTIHTLYKVHEV